MPAVTSGAAKILSSAALVASVIVSPEIVGSLAKQPAKQQKKSGTLIPTNEDG